MPRADADEARRVLDETLAGFLATGPDPNRLESLLTQELIGTVRSFEKPSNKAEALLEGAVFHNDPLRFKKKLAEAQAATSRGLSELANEWLTRPYYEFTGTALWTPCLGNRGRGPLQPAGIGGDSGAAIPGGRRTHVGKWNSPGPGASPSVARHRSRHSIQLRQHRRLGHRELRSDLHGVRRTHQCIRDAAAIEGELERLGSYVDVESGVVSSTVWTGGLTANLPETLALVAELLSNPTYPEEQLELAGKRQIAAIKANRKDAETVSEALLMEKMYGAGHV